MELKNPSNTTFKDIEEKITNVGLSEAVYKKKKKKKNDKEKKEEYNM